MALLSARGLAKSFGSRRVLHGLDLDVEPAPDGAGPEGEAVSRLMKFLFGYDRVRRPIEALSGGEWTRLQLLLLMLQG